MKGSGGGDRLSEPHKPSVPICEGGSTRPWPLRARHGVQVWVLPHPSHANEPPLVSPSCPDAETPARWPAGRPICESEASQQNQFAAESVPRVQLPVMSLSREARLAAEAKVICFVCRPCMCIGYHQQAATPSFCWWAQAFLHTSPKLATTSSCPDFFVLHGGPLLISFFPLSPLRHFLFCACSACTRVVPHASRLPGSDANILV